VRLAQEKLLCFGVPEGKQPTFTLLAEWVPDAKPLDPEAALAKLAMKYFGSHGPATLADLMRWAGVTSAEAKLAVEGAGKALASETISAVRHWLAADSPQPTAAARGTFLLPGFDEYMLGYKDRSPMLPAEFASRIVPGGNGVFRPTVVYDGQVLGTWQASATKQNVRVAASPFAAWTGKHERQIERAAGRYAAFLGKSLAPAP
jgi:hypothetical protein